MAGVWLRFVCVVSIALTAHSLPVFFESDRIDSWDFFIFVQRSPSGVCYQERHEKEGCYYPPNSTVTTIHGLWPTANGTEGPNYCNPAAVFNLTEIESLIPELVQKWPNMESGTAFDSFWSHEWLKHGTCASGVSSLSTEYGFFKTVLDLFNKTNYGEILCNYGIQPSNTTTYKYDQFIDAFEQECGVRPYLECYYDRDYKIQVLTQIGLCLHKNLSIMPCGQEIFPTSACWASEPIYFLASDY